MAPSKWDDEEDDSTPPSSPPAQAVVRRSKFDDEEDDSDVVDSWDAADDSEEEEKKKKAAEEAKAKAEAEAQANKKPKSQRIEEKRMEAMRRRQEEEDESEDSEDEAEKRARLREQEKEGDLKHAEDLFGGAGMGRNDTLRAAAVKPVTLKDPSDPTKTLELSSLSVFNPQSRDQFKTLHETIVPLIANQNSKKAQYPLFATEFVKALIKDLSSEQIKKIASGVIALSNEKLKEEKAADKGGKKTKAQKAKTTLNAGRDTMRSADTNAYEDGLDDGDFM